MLQMRKIEIDELERAALGDRDALKHDGAVERVVELVDWATPRGVITSTAFGTGPG